MRGWVLTLVLVAGCPPAYQAPADDTGSTGSTLDRPEVQGPGPFATEATLYETCAEAAFGETLGPGLYRGSPDAWLDDDPTGCAPEGWVERWFTADVPAKSAVWLHWSGVFADVATGCDEACATDAPAVGDFRVSLYEHPAVAWGVVETTPWLPYELGFDIRSWEPADPPVASDSCEQAASAGPLRLGAWDIPLSDALTDTWHYDAADCPGGRKEGPDAWFRVRLEPGEWLRVDGEPDGCPGARVLLRPSCDAAARCLQPEVRGYENRSPAPEDVFVVVDADDPECRPHALHLEVVTTAPL